MDSTIIAAVIGGLATILAALLAIYFAKEKRKQAVSKTDREKVSLAGTVVEEVLYGPYLIRKATNEDIQWIALKTKELYGEKDSVPLHTKTSWYQKNPNGFWVVVNSHGSCVGSCEILPISDTTLDLIRGGKIKERDKTSNDIIGIREKSGGNILYLENFMSINHDNLPNQWVFKECLINLEQITSTLKVDLENTKIYAMPVSEFKTESGMKRSNSERILIELGFYKIVENTVQGYPLYCGELKSLLKLLKPMRDRYANTISA